MHAVSDDLTFTTQIKHKERQEKPGKAANKCSAHVGTPGDET